MAGRQAPHPAGPYVPPAPSVLPAGFVGRLHLTVPLATVLGLAERPGEISGLGPVDPALARELARAAAANPKTTYCRHRHRRAGTRHRPRLRATRTEKPRPPRPTDKPAPPGDHAPPGDQPRDHPPGDHGPPGGPASCPPPRFAFTASGEDGPPGGYGAWRLSTGLPGQRDLLIALDPVALRYMRSPVRGPRS